MMGSPTSEWVAKGESFMSGQRPTLFRRRLLVDNFMQLTLLMYCIAIACVGVMAAAFFGFLIVISVPSELSTQTPVTLFVMGGVMSFIAMCFLGLYLTNKIAGPLVRLREEMRRVADGETPRTLVPREGDMAKSLYVEYNRLVQRQVLKK